jgi:putative ABC transport system ATP-binding protein
MSPALAANVPDAARRAEALVEHFGLAHRAAHLPSELSTGDRQRTALARALLARPKLLLADEPTGNLDAENGQAALGYLRDFASQGGAVLLVTHDMRAADYAGRVMRLGPPARALAAVAGGGA